MVCTPDATVQLVVLCLLHSFDGLLTEHMQHKDCLCLHMWTVLFGRPALVKCATDVQPMP